jgi:hypothetical protein
MVENKHQKNENKEPRMTWHDAFYQAIQLDLLDYKDDLSFQFEHQLTTQPLRIDVVIVKKKPDISIKKNIAAIFRGYNIFEFKSPEDSLSVSDFYKVHAYANLYVFLHNVLYTDLTLSFVENRHPKALIEHLKKDRKFRVDEKWPGVYNIEGDSLPIQIIETKRLSKAESLWLRTTREGVSSDDVIKVLDETARLGDKAPTSAFLYWFMLANAEVTMEVMKMKYPKVHPLIQYAEQMGVLPESVKRARAEGAQEEALAIAQRLASAHMAPGQISQFTGLSLDQIQSLYSITRTHTTGAEQ